MIQPFTATYPPLPTKKAHKMFRSAPICKAKRENVPPLHTDDESQRRFKRSQINLLCMANTRSGNDFQRG